MQNKCLKGEEEKLISGLYRLGKQNAKSLFAIVYNHAMEMECEDNADLLRFVLRCKWIDHM